MPLKCTCYVFFKSIGTGFIAISFRDDTEQIISALKKGIEGAHFEPVVIKDVEHNN